MKRCPWMSAIAGSAMSMAALSLTPAALADVPPAMDRVPADVPIIITMKNVSDFYSSIKNVAASLNLPMQAMGGLNKAGEMLKMEGLNADGSAAIAIMSVDAGDKAADGDEDADDGDDDQVVMVIPVKDFDAWSKALGDTDGDVRELTIEGNPAFAKNLGGGFAAMSPKKDLLDKFPGKSGNGQAHETLMGPVGRAVAEANSTFVLANIQSLAPKIKEGYGEMKEQAQAAQAMMGQGDAADMTKADAAMDTFLRDATSAVVGFNASEAGVKLEMASQFKEGSELAGYFSSKGSASSLISALPNQPFLFTVAIDSSNPGIRSFFKKYIAAAAKDDPTGMMAGLNPLEAMDKINGMAFSMGASPALLGAMFANSTAYVKTDDPAGYIATVKDTFTKLNEKTLEGVTFNTTFTPDGAKVGGKAVSTWTMRMQFDPNDPAAQQAAQVQMALFGPTGLSGYIAPADGGVVMTYAKNSDLMSKALEAAKTGSGLGSDEALQGVAKQFPSNRTIEAYIGIQSILETALGFAAMSGMAPPDLEIPQDLPPIGLSGTTNEGGLRMTTFVPTKVLQAFKTLADQMGGGMGGGEDEEMPPPPPEKAGQPKF